MNSKYAIPLLALLSSFLFTVNLAGYDRWPPDEPRFAQVSREMMMSGDYLVPHINGEPYTEKPPLFFWLISAVSVPFGDVTELSARIPSAAAGVITILLTYVLARRLYGNTVALWSGLVLMTFQRFWWQARFAQIDMTLTACLTAGFVCFWLWHSERRTRYLVGFYAAIAAGLLAKGPPALVFPLLTAIAFYWGRKSDRRQLHLILGLAAVIAVVLIWLIPARMALPSSSSASDEIGTNLYRQIVGRFFLGVSHERPFYYYLVNLPADLFPWTLVLPWTIVWVWKNRQTGEPMRFLLSWCLPAVFFFSLSAGKRALYLLPIHPALAILVAASLMPLLAGPFRRWRVSIAAVWAVILIGGAAAPFVVLFTEHSDSWSNWFVLITVTAGLSGMQIIWDIRRNASRRLGVSIVAHFALLTTLLVVIAFPQLNLHKSAKEFCAPLRALSERGVEYDLWSFGFSREEYIFYAEHFHRFVPSLPIAFDGLDAEDQARLNRMVNQSLHQAPVELAGGSLDVKGVEALQDALASAYSAANLPEATAEEHRAGVQAAIEKFIASFRVGAPTFLITRERNWEWMVAYCPDADRETVVHGDAVGSRQVILVANHAALRLLASHNLIEDSPNL